MSSSEEPSLKWPRRLSWMLERAWDAGLSERPSLVADVIVTRATTTAGREPVDGRWRHRLGLLCSSLEREAKLSPLGQTIAHGQLVRIVASRARAEALWERNPEIRDRRVDNAVAIVGPMRSGTTRMHRLLACDPAFASTRLFETLEPVPSLGKVDLRAVRAFAGLAFMRTCNPAIKAIHPTSPFAVEEDVGLHAFSLWGPQFDGQWWIPSFARESDRAGPADAYDEFRRLLQTASWRRQIAPDRRWLLKSPQFSEDLDALRRALPGLTVIRLTRPLEEVVASSASLSWHYARVQSDDADRRSFGEHWLRKTVRRERLLEDSLERQPAAITLDYDEVSRDWRGAIGQVYAVLGRQLSPSVEANMARLMRRSKDHRGHHYTLEDFGLDRRTVRAAFA